MPPWPVLCLFIVGSGFELPEDAFDWIRDISSGVGGKYHLEARTYYIDAQYQLPPHTEIYGAGSDPVGGSAIVAVTWPNISNGICGTSAVNRVGFLLGDHSYIGGLHFVGNDSLRYLDNALLCGGAAFETPGCADTGYFSHAPEKCKALTGIGRGIINATLEDITIANLTVQTAFYMAPTPAGSEVSKNITVSRLVTNGTWADGVNIHGAHENILVRDSIVQNSGDDAFAVWSVGLPGASNVTFVDNLAVRPWFRPGGSKAPIGWRNTSECFAVYGGLSVRVLNNTCVESHLAITIFGNDKHVTYGGRFSNDSFMQVEGNVGLSAPCYFGVKYPGRAICLPNHSSVEADMALI